MSLSAHGGLSAHTGLSASASVLDLIGRTPLVRLNHFERETPGVELYAKAEWQNPGGSVKDRAAARMIADGEASGALRPGLTIVDATSGNTGIAYAMVGAARGYKVKLYLPENASPERKLILRAFGAELVLTDPLEGTDGAIRKVRAVVAEEPDRYFYPDQYRTIPTGARTSTPRDPKSSNRPPAASRISSRGSVQAAPSWGPAARFVISIRRSD
jgi:cysteine synthase B